MSQRNGRLRNGAALVLVLLIGAGGAGAATFFVDPESGSMDNPGTAEAPWSTLEKVFKSGQIASRQPAVRPYKGGALEPKNAGAPVGPGDTLLLRSGYHGRIFAKEYYNEDTVFVLAAAGARPRLASVELRSVSRWKLAGLHISPSFVTPYQKSQLLSLSSHGHSGPSSHCAVENCILYSMPGISSWSADDWNTKACNGIGLGGPNMTARGNILRNVNFGISASQDSVLVEYNQVINFSGDGMRGLGDHQVFQYNLVKNCYDVNQNHDDGFQSWSRTEDGVGKGEVVGMVLRGNTIINYEDPNQPHRGALQGIGCFDGMFRDWLVEDNIIVTDHWHGLTLMGAIDSRIVNNTVVDINSKRPGPAWIRVSDHKNGTPSRNTMVSGNIATAFSLGTGVHDENNYKIAFGDYNKCFTDFPSFDMRLLDQCPAGGAGASVLLLAPVVPAKRGDGTGGQIRRVGIFSGAIRNVLGRRLP